MSLQMCSGKDEIAICFHNLNRQLIPKPDHGLRLKQPTLSFDDVEALTVVDKRQQHLTTFLLDSRQGFFNE